MEICANVDEACRLCLHGKGKISVFENENTNRSITPENIFNCVSVKITKEDRLPTGICENCILNVENWCLFKNTCDKTQEALNDWLNGSKLNSELEEESNDCNSFNNGGSVNACETPQPPASSILESNVLQSAVCTEPVKKVDKLPCDIDFGTSQDRTQEITSTLQGEEENKQSSVVSSTKEIEQDTICSSLTDSTQIANVESHQISGTFVSESNSIINNNENVQNKPWSNSVEPMEVSSNTADERSVINIPPSEDIHHLSDGEREKICPVIPIEAVATSSVLSPSLPNEQECDRGATTAESTMDASEPTSPSRNESVKNHEVDKCLDVRLDDTSDGLPVLCAPNVAEDDRVEEPSNTVLDSGVLPDTTVEALTKGSEVPKNDTLLDSDKENSIPNSAAPVPDSSKEKQSKVSESSEQSVENEHSFSDIRIESIATLTMESFFSSPDGKQSSENNIEEKIDGTVASDTNKSSAIEATADNSTNNKETVNVEEQSKETEDSTELSNIQSSDQESVMEVDRSETDTMEQPELPNNQCETGRENQFSQEVVQNIKMEPVDVHETPSCNTNEMFSVRVKSEFSLFDYDDDVPNEYLLNEPSNSGGETNKCDICNRKYSSLSNYLKHLQTKVHMHNASLGPEGHRLVANESVASSYNMDSRLSFNDSYSEDSRLSSYSNDSPMLRSRLCPEEFIPSSPNRFQPGLIRQAKPKIPFPASLSKLPKRKDRCKLCNTNFTYISEMRRHLLSKKHKDNVRLMRGNDRLMRENQRMIRDSERMIREKERYKRERAYISSYPQKEEVVPQAEKSPYPFICPIENCHYTCQKGTRLLDHMRTHGIGQPASTPTQFTKDLDTQIPKPKLSLRQQELLKKELEKKKVNYLPESPDVESLSYDYKCEACGKTFLRESGLKKHGYYCSAIIAAEQQQEIEEKPKTSEENNSDNLRLKKMHCPICNLTFAAKSVFISHVQIYHKGSTLESGLFRPKKSVITSNKLRVKSKKGHSYVCNHCGKKFNLLSSLNFHLKVHSTKHICKICKKGYDSRRAFMDHCRLHFLPPGSKQTLCHKCFRVFKTRGEFYHHRKNDMCSIKLKIYSCNICQHSFKDPSALEEHKIRFHNDMLDASDDEISTPMDHGSSMQNYLSPNHQDYDTENDNQPGPSTKSHSNNINQSTNQPKNDPFLYCDVCDRDYATLSSLKKHMWKYHQTKPIISRRLDPTRPNVLQASISKCWKCKHCKKVCTTRRMLVVHLKKCRYNSFDLEDGMCLQCGKWCDSGKSRICRFCLPDISKTSKSKKGLPGSSNYLTPRGEYSVKQEFNSAPARIASYNFTQSKASFDGSSIRLMKCPVGNKYFRSELLMIKHYSQCDGSCENRCSHCRKLFNSPKEYRIHLWNSNCYGSSRQRSKGNKLTLKSLNSYSESDVSEIESIPAKHEKNDELELSSELSGADSSMIEENSVMDLESGLSNNPSDKIIEEKSIKIGRVCTICNKVISMQRAIYRHVYSCFKIYMLTQESVSCKKCNRTFSKHLSMKENTAAIRQHILECHYIPYYEGEGVTEDGGLRENPPPLLCYVCSFGFSSNENLKRHIMEHRSRKDEINNLVLLLEAEMLSERTLNSDTLPYNIQIQPESCETVASTPARKKNVLSFKVPGSQSLMSRKIIRKKLLECEKCNRKFTNRNKFLRHKKVHGIVTQSVFHEVSENYLDFIADHNNPPPTN